MTGWGQDGPLAPTAGHDIDYIAISGVLSMLGREGGKPTPPINILGDFAGGGLMLAYGVLLALLERERTGAGRVVDAAMVDGAATLFAMFYHGVQSGFWGPRGTNLLDTGAPMYDTYETADGKFMAVGALEPQFWAEMVALMGLSDLPDRNDRAAGPRCASGWPRPSGPGPAPSGRRSSRVGRVRLTRPGDVRGRRPPAQQGARHVRRGRRGTAARARAPPGGRARAGPLPATRLADLSSWGLPEETAAELREAGVLA
nr:hypothetical protein GCM10020093_045700 [Planobispora longispora]